MNDGEGSDHEDSKGQNSDSESQSGESDGEICPKNEEQKINIRLLYNQAVVQVKVEDIDMN